MNQTQKLKTRGHASFSGYLFHGAFFRDANFATWKGLQKSSGLKHSSKVTFFVTKKEAYFGFPNEEGSKCHPFCGDQTSSKCMVIFTDFHCMCIVWVGNIMTPEEPETF